MKSKFSKTMTSLFLIAALVFSGISYQGKEAKAATDQTRLFLFGDLDAEVPQPAGEEVTHDFTVSSNGTIELFVYSLFQNTAKLKLVSATGTVVADEEITIAEYDPYNYAYVKSFAWSYPAAGNYTISLTFAAETTYAILGLQGPAVPQPTPPTSPTQQPVKTPTPSLNAQSVTLTAGFSQTISTYNATGVTWSSSNSSVATVSNGKITGKKPGKATISAKTASGYTMTCSVTVKKNEYSVKKLGVKKVTYGKSGIDIYKVSYDKKGNLILKTRVLNNSNYKLKELRNVKIKIKDNNGKTIATYSAKKIKKVNLKAGKAKAYTFKIKKSKVKNKNANLPLITTSVSGRAYYIR